MSWEYFYLAFTMALVIIAAIPMLFSRKPKPVVEFVNGGLSLSVTRDHNDQFFIDGSLNNYPVKFCIDTGCSVTTLSGRVAKRAGCPDLGAVSVNTAGGISKACDTLIGNIRIGFISFDNLEGCIIEDAPDDFVLLGMNALKMLEFQYKDSKLRLSQVGGKNETQA